MLRVKGEWRIVVGVDRVAGANVDVDLVCLFIRNLYGYLCSNSWKTNSPFH